VLDGARQAPLSEDDYEKLKEAFACVAAMLVRPRTTRRQRPAGNIGRLGSWRPTQPEPTLPHRPDMDANVLERLSVRGRLRLRSEVEATGIAAPEVRERQRIRAERPKVLVADCGQAPLAGQRSTRWNGCAAGRAGRVGLQSTGTGRSRSEKYDETAAAMIAQLK